MRKRMVNYTLIFVLGLILLSCSKEEEFTTGELIGNKINNIINEKNIKKADIYEWGNIDWEYESYVLKYSDIDFTVVNAFLTLTDNTYSDPKTVYYNLENLEKWTVNYSKKTIIFYFR